MVEIQRESQVNGKLDSSMSLVRIKLNEMNYCAPQVSRSR